MINLEELTKNEDIDIEELTKNEDIDIDLDNFLKQQNENKLEQKHG
jgi:hypothetical protein